MPSGLQTFTPSPTLHHISKFPVYTVESRTTTVYIAHGIGVNSVGKSEGAVSKDSSILQAFPVWGYVELVDCSCRVKP